MAYLKPCLLLLLMVCLIGLPQASFGQQTAHVAYLPLMIGAGSASTPPAATRVASAPYFSGTIPFSETSILWFGKVTRDANYSDVRVGYNDDHLFVSLAVFDRRLWYDSAPTTQLLTSWDAASLYLDSGAGQGLSAQSFRIDAQLNNGEQKPYTATYRGSANGWQAVQLNVRTKPGWRGERLNDDGDDRGWAMTYEIPFASLGLSGPPPQGSRWRMMLAVHDRDSAQGPPLAATTWPETAQPASPERWGALRFGLLGYSAPALRSSQTYTIRHKLNGAQVQDVAVGGGAVCGAGLDFWGEWGSKNRAGEGDAAVQNQADIADWPCFAKFYLTFPLTSLPAGTSILSASLILHQMGNSGAASNGQPPPPSYLQVLTVGEDWDEQTMNWNNAPYAVDTVSRSWIGVIQGCGAANGIAWPCVPRQFDVSRAVAEAKASGTPLRLVVYAADSAYSTGKYFTTSDTGDWNAAGRPTLVVKAGLP